MVSSKQKVAKKSHATKKPRGVCKRKGLKKMDLQEEGTLSKPVQEKGESLMRFLQVNDVSTYQTADEDFEKLMTISEICTVLEPISDDETEQLREKEYLLAKLKASMKDPSLSKGRLLDFANWQTLINTANSLLIDCDKPKVAKVTAPSTPIMAVDMIESENESDEANETVRRTAREIDIQFEPATKGEI